MNGSPNYASVETRLRRQGSTLRAQLANVDVAPAVLGRLRAQSNVDRARGGSRRPLAIAIAIAFCALALGTAWAVTTLVFDGGAVTVHREPAATRPTAIALALGHPVNTRFARRLSNSVRLGPRLQPLATAWVDASVASA